MVEGFTYAEASQRVKELGHEWKQYVLARWEGQNLFYHEEQHAETIERNKHRGIDYVHGVDVNDCGDGDNLESGCLYAWCTKDRDHSEHVSVPLIVETCETCQYNELLEDIAEWGGLLNVPEYHLQRYSDKVIAEAER